MRGLLIGAALAAGLGMAATAQDAQGTTTTVTTVTTTTTAPAVPDAGYAPGTVVASCFRGPLTDVVWDRSEPVFVDSLVAFGYDYATAGAIADRVCRDPALVDDDEALKAAVERIIAEAPRTR